jgi:phage-related protein
MIDSDNIYILHVCKKQKNKAELTDIRIAKQRAKEI